jgi:hypothetical protein
MRSNQPHGAARVLLEHRHMLVDEELVERVAHALINHELFEKAGELYRETERPEKALDCFCQGKDFGRAIQVGGKTANSFRVFKNRFEKIVKF